MKNLKIASFLLVAAVVLTGCSKQKSATTGWNYNDPEWGGFEVSQYNEQITAPGLVFIEGGAFTMGRVSDDSRYQWNNVAHNVTVSSFYMDETEVTNQSYREYVYWMRRAYGEEYPERVRAIYPDTNCWRDKLAWREGFVDYYFQSPIYDQYPVVGVTWEQAQKYCIWRTDRVNEKILVDKGIIVLDLTDLRGETAFQTDVYLAGQYRGESKNELDNLDPSAGGEPRQVRREDGILVPHYRLPTEAEWEFAARGRENNRYPWKVSGSKDDEGCYYANFKPERGNYTKDGSLITTRVGSYKPNSNGLYDMAGNVAEWTSTTYTEAGILQMNDMNPELYYNAAVEDPYYMKKKAVRGGSWKDPEKFIESSWRTYEYQNEQRSYIGFRCVRTQVGTPASTKKNRR